MQKDSFNKILLNYLLVLFVINNVFIGLAYYFSWEPWPALAVEVMIIGNLLIGYQTRSWHKKAKTGEYPEDTNFQTDNQLGGTEPVWNANKNDNEYNPEWYSLKNLASLAEIIFYTAMFLFSQVFLVAGWLIVKAIGHHSASKSPESTLAVKGGSAVAILRLGTLLSLGTALVSALLFSFSGIKDTRIFNLLLEFLK